MKMGKPRYYDKDGHPLDLLTWGRLFEDRDYKRVSHDLLGPYEISTVWMGLDHNWYSNELSIFETMIFCTDEKDELYHYQDRYSCLEDAICGHQQTMAMVKVQIAIKEAKAKKMDPAHQVVENDSDSLPVTSDQPK